MDDTNEGETMTPNEIRTELADCKAFNRYLTDTRGDRFWVFGLPENQLLVRRVVDGTMKPIRTMEYGEVVRIEPFGESGEPSPVPNISGPPQKTERDFREPPDNPPGFSAPIANNAAALPVRGGDCVGLVNWYLFDDRSPIADLMTFARQSLQYHDLQDCYQEIRLKVYSTNNQQELRGGHSKVYMTAVRTHVRRWLERLKAIEKPAPAMLESVASEAVESAAKLRDDARLALLDLAINRELLAIEARAELKKELLPSCL
jgi:hypothetical protein